MTSVKHRGVMYSENKYDVYVYAPVGILSFSLLVRKTRSRFGAPHYNWFYDGVNLFLSIPKRVTLRGGVCRNVTQCEKVPDVYCSLISALESVFFSKLFATLYFLCTLI